MKLTDQHFHGFDWDPANEAKILAKHGMDREKGGALLLAGTWSSGPTKPIP